jgi:hypothetical protein
VSEQSADGVSGQPPAADADRVPPAPWLAQPDGDGNHSWAESGPHPGPSWIPSSLSGAEGSSVATLTTALSRPEVRLGVAFLGGLVVATIIKRLGN